MCCYGCFVKTVRELEVLIGMHNWKLQLNKIGWITSSLSLKFEQSELSLIPADFVKQNSIAERMPMYGDGISKAFNTSSLVLQYKWLLLNLLLCEQLRMRCWMESETFMFFPFFPTKWSGMLLKFHIPPIQKYRLTSENIWRRQ